MIGGYQLGGARQGDKATRRSIVVDCWERGANVGKRG